MLCLSGFELYSRWVPLSCSESSFSPVTPVSSSLQKIKISNSNRPFETMTSFLLIKTGIHFDLSFTFKFGNPSEV